MKGFVGKLKLSGLSSRSSRASATPPPEANIEETVCDPGLSAAEHSYVCDDVKQALKKCKAPVNFGLLETHLAEHQKPCGPKQTYADLSQVRKLFQPQERPPQTYISDSYHAPSHESNKLMAKNRKKIFSASHTGRSKSSRAWDMTKDKESKQKSRSTSDGGIMEKLDTVIQKNTIDGGSDRSSAPEVPAFLKKYLLQKKLVDETSETSARSLDVMSVDRFNRAKETESPRGLPQWVNNEMFYHLGPSESTEDKKNGLSSTAPETLDTIRLYEVDCETPTTRVSDGAPESVVSGVYHEEHKSIAESLGESSHNDFLLLRTPSSSTDPGVKINTESQAVRRALTSSSTGADSLFNEGSRPHSVPPRLQSEGRAAVGTVWPEEPRGVPAQDNPDESIGNKQGNSNSSRLDTILSESRMVLLEKIKDGTALRKSSANSALSSITTKGESSQDFHAEFSGAPIGVAPGRGVEFIQTSIWQDSDSSDTGSLWGR